MKKLILLAGLYSSSLLAASAQGQQELHFLHWWTSTGEVQSANLVKTELAKHQIKVVDVPVRGGGGTPAKSILQARAIAGNPPELAQIEGPAIKAWATLGFLHPLTSLAKDQQWEETLYPFVRSIQQYNGDYYAIPVTVHRLNWMWVNHNKLAEYQQTVPQTWEQLITVFNALKQKGVMPLAIGNEPWQVGQLFENIAFSIGGQAFYQKAFIELDADALSSPSTYEALSKFRQISNIIGDKLIEQRWDQASQSLLRGDSVFQISGDWVAGELMSTTGEFPDSISCYPTPSKTASFLYNIDSFAFFNSAQLSETEALKVAGILSSKQFLHDFNLKKGSIPTRKDIELTGYNQCAVKSQQDLQQALLTGNVMPSIVDSMAVSPLIQKAALNELFRFFNDPTVTSDDVILHLQNVSKSGIAF